MKKNSNIDLIIARIFVFINLCFVIVFVLTQKTPIVASQPETSQMLKILYEVLFPISAVVLFVCFVASFIENTLVRKIISVFQGIIGFITEPVGFLSLVASGVYWHRAKTNEPLPARALWWRTSFAIIFITLQIMLSVIPKYIEKNRFDQIVSRTYNAITNPEIKAKLTQNDVRAIFVITDTCKASVMGTRLPNTTTDEDKKNITTCIQNSLDHASYTTDDFVEVYRIYFLLYPSKK